MALLPLQRWAEAGGLEREEAKGRDAIVVFSAVGAELIEISQWMELLECVKKV